MGQLEVTPDKNPVPGTATNAVPAGNTSAPDTLALSAATTTSTMEQLKAIEAKLAIVEKKLTDKWILPVVIAVITAILAFGNYYTQRMFINSDIFKNQVAKTNAEIKSQNASAFYKHCYTLIDSINKSFESYCTIGKSKMDDSLITAKSIRLTSLIDVQFPLDPAVKKCLQHYIGYVVEQLLVLGDDTAGVADLESIYTTSKRKYDSATTEINAAFLDPSR